MSFDIITYLSKERRFYSIQLQPNLFGGISVVCSWGSMDSKRGSHKIIFCESEVEAESILQIIKRRRKARGYMMEGN